MGREKYFHTTYDRLLVDKKKELTGGIEIETYLTYDNGKLVMDNKITDELLSKLPDAVTKDYYAYQLEIRTQPHDNPEDIIKELETNIKLCHLEASKMGLNIRFSSWLGENEMFNGLHFHIRMKDNNPFYNMVVNSYPLVLSLASFFRCSPGGFNLPSKRLDSSPHCGIPNLIGKNLARPDNQNRFRDIVINQFKEGDRHRLKRVNTLEIRMFDVPCDWEYTKSLIMLIFNVFRKVDIKVPLFNEKDVNEMNKYYETASITRDEVCCSRHTYNYFLNDFNDNVVSELMKRFDIPLLKENLITFIDEDPMNYDLYVGFPFLEKHKKSKTILKGKIENVESVRVNATNDVVMEEDLTWHSDTVSTTDRILRYSTTRRE